MSKNSVPKKKTEYGPEGVHINDILKQRNLSNLKTFKRLYFKNVESLNEPIDLSKKLLENISK